MSRAIAMPTYRRGTPEDGRNVWADLRVCLHAIEAYALDYVDEVVIAWDGPWAPDGMPTNPKFRYLERPQGMDMVNAWIWAIEQTDSDEIIQMGDDVVLHPDTLRLLIEDIETVKRDRPGVRLGMMGARSDFVAGAQNIRIPNGGVLEGLAYSSENYVLETPHVFTVLAWYTRAAWEHVGRFPEGCVWGGDLLFSYDLRKLGYTHFISRAYVHHVGWRGSEAAGGNAADMNRDGWNWMRENRPDYYDYAVENGYIAPGMH